MTSDNNIRKRTKKCQLKSGKDTPAPQGQVSVTLDPPQSYLGVARYLHQREPVTKSVLALQSLSDFSKKQKGFRKDSARRPQGSRIVKIGKWFGGIRKRPFRDGTAFVKYDIICNAE